jgi:Na+/citrate or Na+/malate symporter
MIAIDGRTVAALTLPILFAVGLFLMPWAHLVEGFAPLRLVTIAAVVLALSAVGWLSSRMVSLDAGEGTLVTLSRAAMGGTGCLAILAAGGRMDLMPYAQIATRIGGIATVSIALAAASYLTR